jgi:hypothetical protein
VIALYVIGVVVLLLVIALSLAVRASNRRHAEVIACRNGGPPCAFCRSRMARGINPYTGELDELP